MCVLIIMFEIAHILLLKTFRPSISQISDVCIELKITVQSIEAKSENLLRFVIPDTLGDFSFQILIKHLYPSILLVQCFVCNEKKPSNRYTYGKTLEIISLIFNENANETPARATGTTCA